MHASTSPFYPMIAALDVAAAMMDGPGGTTLTGESITRGDRLPQAHQVALTGDRRARRRSTDGSSVSGSPSTISDPATGEQYAFADAPDELLATDPGCWTLAARRAVARVRSDDGRLLHAGPDQGHDHHAWNGRRRRVCAERGIPAQIVTMFLDEQRIEIEKTGDYILLVLFSIGMTKGKWGTLLDGLLAIQTRLRREHAAECRASQARRRPTGALRRPRARRPLRRDARRPPHRPHAGAA